MSKVFTIYFYVCFVIGFVILTIIVLLLMLMDIPIIADLTGLEKIRDYINSTIEHYIDSIIAKIMR